MANQTTRLADFLPYLMSVTTNAVSDLIASNATFGALLFSDLSNKLSALSERKKWQPVIHAADMKVD